MRGQANRPMRTTHIAAGIVLAAALAGVFVLAGGDPRSGAPEKAAVALHKSAACGCCGVYGSYLRREGYGVEVHNTNDLAAKKRELGVPRELESCHTSEVGGYVVEGHVPEEAIAKLLQEKPDIVGIGMGGMPSGSPGMPGPKQGPFVIYEIGRGSLGGVFMTL